MKSRLARKPKRPIRRRNFKKRGYKTINVAGRSLNPVPQRTIVKMKYAESVTTNAVGEYIFNLNSIFDPNRTGIGHQPYGHDTFNSLYNRYRVIACSYRVQCPNASQNIQFGVVPTNEVWPFSGIDELKEHPRSRYATQMFSGPAVSISGKVYLPSLVGRTKAQYMADDRYQAQFGTSPAELGILQILVSNQLGSNLMSNAVNIILEYTVECFDVKTLNQS